MVTHQRPGTDWKTIIAVGLMLGGLYAGLKVDINDVKGDVREAKATLTSNINAVQAQASRIEQSAISREAAELIVRKTVEEELERRRVTPVFSRKGSTVQ